SGGTLLLAAAEYVERRDGARVERIAIPPGPASEVRGLFDDGRHLWLKLPARGSFVRVDGAWRKIADYGMPHNYLYAAPQGEGKVWFGGSDGLITQFDNGRVLATLKTDGLKLGALTALSADDGLLVCGEQGIAVLLAGGLRKLTAARPEVLYNVSGVVVDANGDRWLNGARGVVHVTRADWQRATAQPDQPLSYDLFDESDGYAGEAATGVRFNSALAAGGQLWFATTSGLRRLDPRKLWRGAVMPRAEIRSITAGQNYPAQAGLRLPPGTSQLRIDYTGLGAVKPEKLQFRYRLDGVDQDWQDAGARRSAYYTNLAPGAYRFHLQAVNEDGIHSKEETLTFGLEPRFVQTSWFMALLAALAAAALYLLYRYRLRVGTRRALERINLRAAERESIARDLHDTLLQSMQGVILNVKALSSRLPAGEPIHQMMERTVRQATAALVEGRDRVSELRAAEPDQRPLAAALHDIAQAQRQPAPRFALHSEGRERELHPVVRDELLLMGRECLLNAFRHAQASEVRVLLQYGERSLRLSVGDNGGGLPPAVAAARARPGHWGLPGLYERADRLHARLELDTGAAGTSWTITVPAELAYRRREAEASA
ncbi:ATP-binding protein, partial [Duganella callida]